jgi:hypothetical protein
LWPTGWFDATVRLYAGNRVVEQRFGLDDAEGNRLLLNFDGGSTTENGQPRTESYSILQGQVTFGVPPPWLGSVDFGPDTVVLDNGDTHALGFFTVVPEPMPVGSGCKKGTPPRDIAALADSLRSDPDLEVTRPVAASVGEITALQMDMVAAPGASSCADWGMPLPITGARSRPGPGLEHGHTMRLYLVDLPEGLSARTLAITFAAPDAAFESVLEDAPRILESFEFLER